MLLTEKYRPNTINDLVFINDDYENKFKSWVANKSLDSHLLFYGVPGTGKSSSIRVLLNELGVKDFIRVNTSDKTSVDDMRKIIEYASVPPLEDKFKLVILEEFERASKQAQSSLKYVLEQYSDWCHFIFTSNDISKVDDAIISRCQSFHFNTLKCEEFIKRIVTILNEEKINFGSVEVLIKYVNTYYPDLRACLNSIVAHTVDGILSPLDDQNHSIDKYSSIVNAVVNNTDLVSLKKMITEYLPNEEFNTFYQYMYNHLEMFSTNSSCWDDILLKIAEYLYRNETVAYPDINLAACLIEIRKLILPF